MVIWVRDGELEKFLSIIPEEMQEEVKSGEYLCLGGLYDSASEEMLKTSDNEASEETVQASDNTASVDASAISGRTVSVDASAISGRTASIDTSDISGSTASIDTSDISGSTASINTSAISGSTVSVDASAISGRTASVDASDISRNTVSVTSSDLSNITAAGVLIFSPEDGITDDDELLTVINIKWIYVAKDFREKGIANEMMQALADVLENNPAQGIICDIPFGSEYDLAEAFFASWGFDFEVIDSPEVIITKEDFEKRINNMSGEDIQRMIIDPEKIEGFRSIADIPKDVFKRGIDTLKALEKDGLLNEVSDDRDLYAADTSCAFVHNNEISSVLLFERMSEKVLRLVMLAGTKSATAKELRTLLQCAVTYFYQNYPEDAVVQLSIITDRGRNLIAHIFPEKAPIPVRRGFFY